MLEKKANVILAWMLLDILRPKWPKLIIGLCNYKISKLTLGQSKIS